MSASNPIESLVRRIESTAALDSVAKKIGGQVRSLISPGPAKDALSGTWLGHALHPMLTDVVIGSFTSASLLDVLVGEEADVAAERLIALGIAAYLPTAASGINDWADTEIADEYVRRVGLVHANTNAVALGLYTASLAARRRGDRGRGVTLGALGAAVLALGGYIGGHLTLRRGVGPDQTVFDRGPSEWTQAAESGQLQDGQPTRVVVDDTPIMLLRSGEQLFALHDRCSHRGCSLSQGEIEGSEVVCPCHGSRFDLRDGSVHQGPATAPQPAFETRERDGAIEIQMVPPSLS